jgi:hypothetical protein
MPGPDHPHFVRGYKTIAPPAEPEDAEDERPRFYLDEDVPYAAAEIAAAYGLNVRAARDIFPTLPQDDELHLETAARDRRIMVTYNRNDFLYATRNAAAKGGAHSGLLILVHRLPRRADSIARALEMWVRRRIAKGAWPMQPYETDFLSG